MLQMWEIKEISIQMVSFQHFKMFSIFIVIFCFIMVLENFIIYIVSICFVVCVFTIHLYVCICICIIDMYILYI